MIKHEDNLRPEGDFSKRPEDNWAPGERAPVVKRPDNLRPEGDFSQRPQEECIPLSTLE